jgi:hypothetical protein
MPSIKTTNYQVQIKVFETFGCRYIRTHGDHLVYHFPGSVRPVIIPKYKEVPVFVIMNNMKIVGMSREEYFQILENI